MTQSCRSVVSKGNNSVASFVVTQPTTDSAFSLLSVSWNSSSVLPWVSGSNCCTSCSLSVKHEHPPFLTARSVPQLSWQITLCLCRIKKAHQQTNRERGGGGDIELVWKNKHDSAWERLLSMDHCKPRLHSVCFCSLVCVCVCAAASQSEPVPGYYCSAVFM